MLGKRLLVIEDDKDSLDAICEQLRRAGYELLTAETGREGLRLLHGEPRPDLVLLDFWLPDITGHAFLTTRARWPGAAKVPVLLVTGDDAWVDEHTDLKQLGAVDLLRKPFDFEVLLRAIAAALSPRGERAEPSEPPVVLVDNDTAVAAAAARQVRRLSDLLVRASEVLAQGTDVITQVRDVARAIVPAYAASCVIERTDLSAALREVLWTQHESAALDGDLREWVRQPGWLAEVLTDVAESGKPRLLDLQDEAQWLAIGGSRADVATARALGFEWAVVVPMIARRRLFGVLTCASRASRRYGRSHMEAFADLGHRVALALDNAELANEAQRARQEYDELLRTLPTLLQQPLAALTQAADKVREPVDGDPAAGRALADTVARETRRIQEQLRELEDYAALQAGRLQLRTRALDLAALVRRVIDTARPYSGRRSLTLRVDPDVEGLQVDADPERLAQAVSALVGSTLCGTPAGAVIDVSISRVDGELQLTVCDPGPVFAERDITLLSASADYAIGHEAAQNKELLPLQLRLARALLLAQGGRVWAHNATDKGKAVSFALRLHEGEAALENTNGAAQDPAILLVDSDLAFRRELQEILVERGYRVETAENGLQAWQFLLGNPAPALILFDLMLPAMDGWELHAAIKAHETLQTVPTVVVSGLDRYRIEASLPDAQGYIEKPIRTAQLFEVVQRHVASPARPRTLSVRPASCL